MLPEGSPLSERSGEKFWMGGIQSGSEMAAGLDQPPRTRRPPVARGSVLQTRGASMQLPSITSSGSWKQEARWQTASKKLVNF